MHLTHRHGQLPSAATCHAVLCCALWPAQAAIGGGLMLISANNITVTDSVISDNSATVDPSKVCQTVEAVQRYCFQHFTIQITA
jgi:hypothetical protein